ncbi:MAG: RNA polymerase sigma factor [Kiloniellales bacterium]|nr:RNA polymerase sigma factor [Kiloniellales bacterium]
MTEASERELIERAQGGDRAAFEALLRRHYEAIYRMAYKWCGSRADAQDIAQSVCVKLARSLGSYQFRSGFLTWLYPLVINTAKDWARSRARHAGDGLDPDRGDAALNQAPAAEDTVFANQVLARIRALPEKEREAIFLVFSEGLSHREAAEAMDCRESTVSWYIHEARKKLRPLRDREARHG